MIAVVSLTRNREQPHPSHPAPAHLQSAIVAVQIFMSCPSPQPAPLPSVRFTPGLVAMTVITVSTVLPNRCNQKKTFKQSINIISI